MKKQKISETPTVEFKHTKIVNDDVTALVNHFTGKDLGEFTLEIALEKLKENNKKIKEFKESLISSSSTKEVIE